MAVYTPLSPDDVTAQMSCRGLGPVLSCAGIAAGVENTNYKVETPQGAFILTLFEGRSLKADLPFCLDMMAHLGARGLPVAGVVRDRDGAALTVLKERPCAVTAFLQGTGGDLESLTAAKAAAAGATLARMHLAVADFKTQSPPVLDFDAWTGLIETCGTRADERRAGFSRDLAAETAWQRAHPPAPGLPRGAVHADFFPDNVFFNAGAVSGVIDFYFACTDAFVYDLMLAVNAWGFAHNGAPERERIEAFVQAYVSVRPLGADERAALPLFGRRAALRIVATRLYDALHPKAGALVSPKDPLAHWRILDFHRGAADAAAYGV